MLETEVDALRGMPDLGLAIYYAAAMSLSWGEAGFSQASERQRLRWLQRHLMELGEMPKATAGLPLTRRLT